MIFLLFLIAVFICFNSFSANTWLSGWDTLHPEFNFLLAFERLIFGVFRSDQGLGAVAAHSHMADLPRVILLFLGSLVFPISILRYLFISLCFIVGGLGAFVFIKEIILKGAKYNSIFAFLGGLFYLLNLGTLQQFYVPFEMFTVQFAVLPWLFYFATSYLLNPNKKTLIFFSLTTLLSTPQAYASTLWFAYFLALVLYLAVFAKSHFKEVKKLVILTLLLNLFWLLPASYFVISGNARNVANAKINKIFSEEAFTYNKSYGNFADTIILKNFLFDFQSYDGKDSFVPLLTGWIEHLSNPKILAIGFFISGLALIGLIFALFRVRKLALALILPLVLSVVFLLNQNPPLDVLFSLFREKIPLFGEAMRFPFTKFSIIFVFMMASFFALGNKFLYSVISKVSNPVFVKIFIVSQLLLFSSLFFTYMRPAFEGNFISKKIQVKIPQEYFEMFDWLNQQPEGRVASFPAHSFWGWIYYKWGFQGAQFISFGIKHPLLDRDYDRWNPLNEEYFRQISYAVYSKDVALLETVLKKYNISYLLLDKNVTVPGNSEDKEALFNENIESLFSASSKISLVKNFNQISIYIYTPERPTGLIVSPLNFVSVDKAGGVQDIDLVYKKYGDYISGTKEPQIYAPMRSLIDNQNILNPKIVSTEGEKVQIHTKNLAKELALDWNNYLENEFSLPVELESSIEKDNLMINIIPKLHISLGEIEPLKLSYEVKNPLKNSRYKEKVFINIDQYQTVVSKGAVFLSTNTFNNLAFYNPESEKKQSEQVLSNIINNVPIEICSSSNSQLEVAKSVLDNSGISLKASFGQGCVRIPIYSVLNKDELVDYKSLVHIRFNINSQDESLGHYCIFDTDLGRCTKEKKNLPQGEVEDFVTVDKADLDRLELIFFVDALNNTAQISYTNISFGVLNPVSFLTIPLDHLKNAFKYLQIKNQDNVLQIGNFKDLGSFSYNFLDHDIKANFCGSVFPKKFTRVIDLNSKVIEYSSKKGSSCDFFSFPNFPHNSGYLINIESENVSGLPIRMCVANPLSKRCDLFVSLGKNKNFTSELFLLPPINDGGVGYNIHLDNYAVGNIESTNKIKKLQIMPFPYYFISQTGFKDVLPIQSDLEIKSSNQIFPGIITLRFDNRENLGLVVLNRAYEKGWWMIGGEHVLANDWANGWLVKTGSKTTIIFYWPQVLEFLGLLIIILLGIKISLPILDRIKKIWSNIKVLRLNSKK